MNKKYGGPLFFLAVVVIGLYIVKWNPYYAKAFLAAAKHSIGASILTGKTGTIPAPSWGAAVSYAANYFKAVWQAVVLGLLLGSLVQVLIPQKLVQAYMGSTNTASMIRSGVTALPGMMCTCCAAPVTAGLRRRSASIRSALAFFLGNPVLNPATIIFMGFVLSWKVAVFRIVFGIILVFVTATLASRLAGESPSCDVPVTNPLPLQPEAPLWQRWWQAFRQLVIDTIPAYLIVVFILGAARAFLFPQISPEWGNGILFIIGFAIAGTLFVIPTAAEIPIVQSMLHLGLGLGPGMALLMTLPAISLPSLLIVQHEFPPKVLAAVFCSVVVIGIISGCIAVFVF